MNALLHFCWDAKVHFPDPQTRACLAASSPEMPICLASPRPSVEPGGRRSLTAGPEHPTVPGFEEAPQGKGLLTTTLLLLSPPSVGMFPHRGRERR
ncbi:unnamed protein product [Arctogadus glacialis]